MVVIEILNKRCVKIDDKIVCSRVFEKYVDTITKAVTSDRRTFKENYFIWKDTVKNCTNILKEVWKPIEPPILDLDSYLKYIRKEYGGWRKVRRETAIDRLNRLGIKYVMKEKTPMMPQELWEARKE
ncbi:MAG TPA: hypothetical protein ENG63_06280 [Candidatus Desulfofervidus auxilii]|uniref:Uncharacterized protein n=1 Tax=Desulfofervidus auxilii TaxID=1621989 RepID=A0A7C0Y5M2_DESA2|nr:hypothetical protein [Candidatus Desulfofervidus auxilii]